MMICTVPVNAGRHGFISWMVSKACTVYSSDRRKYFIIGVQDGEKEEGRVVYPGEERALVELSSPGHPRETVCSNVTGTTCIFSIDPPVEDHYTAYVTLTNDAGSSEPVSLSFTCESDCMASSPIS